MTDKSIVERCMDEGGLFRLLVGESRTPYCTCSSDDYCPYRASNHVMRKSLVEPQSEFLSEHLLCRYSGGHDQLNYFSHRLVKLVQVFIQYYFRGKGGEKK